MSQVTCKIFDTIDYTFNSLFTATAPITYGAGQEIYYTDVTGVITIPSNIASLAGGTMPISSYCA